jgi:hypothetical protein
LKKFINHMYFLCTSWNFRAWSCSRLFFYSPFKIFLSDALTFKRRIR